MTSSQAGKRKDREDDFLGDEQATAKVQAMSFDDDNWEDVYKTELQRYLGEIEDAEKEDRNFGPTIDPPYNLSEQPTYQMLSDLKATKSLLKSSNGTAGGNKYLKMLERQLEMAINPKDQGTKFKGHLAPRMVSWSESRKGLRETSLSQDAMNPFMDTLKGMYLNSQICDLLHGDVSPANMFWYFGKKGTMVGVLNDFDHHDETRSEYYKHDFRKEDDSKTEETKCAPSQQR